MICNLKACFLEIMANHIDAIISGLISGIPILIALFLERYFVHLSEKKRIDKEFVRIKNHINALSEDSRTVDEWLVSFQELKHFLDCNYEYLEIEENDWFYKLWLKQPSVDASLISAASWFKEKKLNNEDKCIEMFEDLAETKSPKRSWMFW